MVLAILQRHLPGREVRAFGSRVRHTAKPFSDLDLAIIGNEPLPATVFSAMADDFDESTLPFKVDLVDWASASPSFREIILNDAVQIVAPASSAG